MPNTRLIHTQTVKRGEREKEGQLFISRMSKAHMCVAHKKCQLLAVLRGPKHTFSFIFFSHLVCMHIFFYLTNLIITI
jgi:hypothetical protein